MPSTPGTLTLAASALLANDLDFQNLANPQSLKLSWVGDAIGGSVSLSADKQTVTFTPTAGSTPAAWNLPTKSPTAPATPRPR